jgi:hypothetical protein
MRAWIFGILLGVSACGSDDDPSGTGGSAGSAGSSAEPITAPDRVWTWVPFEQAKCRDGTGTGLVVNLSSAAKKVVIYLQGGGACFNQISCDSNPSHFDEGNFNELSQNPPGGIFDRSRSDNPVQDWSYFVVPYCTGDVHAGDNETPPAKPGVPPNQKFVGYRNMAAFLARIVATVPEAEHVLLTGESAGGYGSSSNFLQTQRAFGATPVTLIDDSGPMMASQWASSCLQSNIRELWNLDATLLADCEGDCTNADGWLEPLATHMVSSYPDRQLGLISSLNDDIIRFFLGMGQNNCAEFSPALSTAQFEAGLTDLRDRMMAPYPNFGTYYIPSDKHTFITSAFYETTVSGKVLASWVGDMLAGSVADVAP